MNDIPPVPDIVGVGEAACPDCGTRHVFPADAPFSPCVRISLSVRCECGRLIEIMQRPPAGATPPNESEL